MNNVSRRLACQLEHRKIRIAREIAIGLGVSTAQLYQIDGSFYDADPILGMVYDKESRELALVFQPGSRGLPLNDDFYRDVLGPLKEFIIQADGDLCSNDFCPIERAMDRLKKIY